MDINPLITDLIKYKEDLLDVIEIAFNYNDLKIADRYVASHIAEIKVGKVTDNPFQQVASLYCLSLHDVVNNIRAFTNKVYKTDIMSIFVTDDINFESDII